MEKWGGRSKNAAFRSENCFHRHPECELYIFFVSDKMGEDLKISAVIFALTLVGYDLKFWNLIGFWFNVRIWYDFIGKR